VTGPDHYREAETLLDQGSTAEATVHALLAVAAAVGLNHAVTGLPGADHTAWTEAASTRR
jgi:hypothetical protein